MNENNMLKTITLNEQQHTCAAIKTTIKKWGNSQAVRIPKEFLDAMDLKENDEVELNINDKILIIKKVRKYQSLQERMEQFYGKPIEEIFIDSTEEVNTGAPMGKEYW